MVFATSYPFLDILWTMIIFFAWVIFIWIAITVLIDLFRRHDLSGWVKALWCVVIIVLPFLGVLSYLILYHADMADRRIKDTEAAQAQFDQYVRQTASSAGPATEIDTAKKLLEAGTITQAEFDAIKAKALAHS
jgi:predicted PurR-regulated permease PerM